MLEERRAYSQNQGALPVLPPITEHLTVLFLNRHLMLLEGLMAAVKELPEIEVVGASALLDDAVHLAEKALPNVTVLGIDQSEEIVAIETVRRLRALVPSTAVILLADSADGPLLAKALEAGCSSLMTKGRSITDLLVTIKAAAKGDFTFPLGMLDNVMNRQKEISSGSDLTRRETEVLHLLAAGESTTAISNRLTLSSHTVRNHIRGVLTKLCVHSRLEAVLEAQRLGLLTGDYQLSCP